MMCFPGVKPRSIAWKAKPKLIHICASMFSLTDSIFIPDPSELLKLVEHPAHILPWLVEMMQGASSPIIK